MFSYEGCCSHFLFYTDRSHCHCGLAPFPIYPSSASASAVVPVSLPIFGFSTCCHLCILILDGLVLPPIYVAQTITTPTSWDPTGGHLSGILREKFPKQPKCDSLCKYCPTQLSALKFLPWMLNAFIHTLSLAYFFCYMTKRTNTLPWPLERITDLTFWHWLIVWTLILTPQFVVFAAVIRVRRFDPNSVQLYQP